MLTQGLNDSLHGWRGISVEPQRLEASSPGLCKPRQICCHPARRCLALTWKGTQAVSRFSLPEGVHHARPWRADELAGMHREPAMEYKMDPNRQPRFIIRSCFGGSNAAFVASGSEVIITHFYTSAIYSILPLASTHQQAPGTHDESGVPDVLYKDVSKQLVRCVSLIIKEQNVDMKPGLLRGLLSSDIYLMDYWLGIL